MIENSPQGLWSFGNNGEKTGKLGGVKRPDCDVTVSLSYCTVSSPSKEIIADIQQRQRLLAREIRNRLSMAVGKEERIAIYRERDRRQASLASDLAALGIPPEAA